MAVVSILATSVLSCGTDCLKCSNENKCEVCRQNYDKEDGSNVCFKLVDLYCIKADQLAGTNIRASCSQCASGYRLENNKCRICEISGCKNCTTDISKCDECYEGQLKTVDRAIQSCDTKCGVENCAKCLLRDKCDSCMSGYFLSSDGKNCTSCTKSNCDRCAISPQYCSRCKTDYLLDGEICTLCPYGCANCTDLNTCQLCDDQYGFYMKSDGKCYFRGYDGHLVGVALWVIVVWLGLAY